MAVSLARGFAEKYYVVVSLVYGSQGHSSILHFNKDSIEIPGEDAQCLQLVAARGSCLHGRRSVGGRRRSEDEEEEEDFCLFAGGASFSS